MSFISVLFVGSRMLVLNNLVVKNMKKGENIPLSRTVYMYFGSLHISVFMCLNHKGKRTTTSKIIEV